MDSSAFQFGKKPRDFPPADQRFSTHERQVERPVPVDQGKDSGNQLRTLEFPDVAEGSCRSKVIRFKCIAPRA
jgi:hypothetical protein